jgi:hypothetical protein
MARSQGDCFIMLTFGNLRSERALPGQLYYFQRFFSGELCFVVHGADNPASL